MEVKSPPSAARTTEERIRRKVKNVDVLIIHGPTCWDPTYIHRTRRKCRFSSKHANSRPFSDLFVFELSSLSMKAHFRQRDVSDYSSFTLK